MQNFPVASNARTFRSRSLHAVEGRKERARPRNSAVPPRTPAARTARRGRGFNKPQLHKHIAKQNITVALNNQLTSPPNHGWSEDHSNIDKSTQLKHGCISTGVATDWGCANGAERIRGPYHFSVACGGGCSGCECELCTRRRVLPSP